MGSARGADLLRTIEKLGIPIIEDDVYRVLDTEPPIAGVRQTAALSSTASPRTSPWR